MVSYGWCACATCIYALSIVYSLSHLHASCDIVRAREPIVSSHLTGLNDTKHDFIITPLSETVTIEYFVFMCIDVLDVVFKLFYFFPATWVTIS